MGQRRQNPLFRLIASLFLGVSVLAFFAFVSTEMATHYAQEVAEDTIREAFAEGSQAEDGARYDAICRVSDSDAASSSECDPKTVRAERSLRFTSCSGRSFRHLFGKQWSCEARFTDGTALSVHVSLGFRRHRLEFVLPPDETDARLPVSRSTTGTTTARGIRCLPIGRGPIASG